jgi:tetratricopeptide (TPR) repeat protein
MVHAFPHSETLTVLEEACKLAHKAKYEGYEAYAHYLCGFILSEEGEYRTARDKANDSLYIYQRIREKHGIAISFNLLAKIVHDEGHYAEAGGHALQTLKIEQELGDLQGIAGSLNTLGLIAWKYERLKEALDLMILSALIMTQIGHAGVQQARKNLMAQFAKQRYTEEQQQELFQQVSEAYQKDGGREWIENALARLGEVNN